MSNLNPIMEQGIESDHSFLFFDTETTSLYAARGNIPGGEVIQFAGIQVDSNFRIKRVINRYCMTKQRIDPGAQGVHGISTSMLAELSEGKAFETVLREEKLRELNNVTWIAFNIPFDVRMMKQTSTQNGYEPIDFGFTTTSLSFKQTGIFRYEAMDPLKSIYGVNYRVKLETLIDKLLDSKDFLQMCTAFKEKCNIKQIKSGETDFLHNAFYDTLGLFALIKKYKNLLLR